MPKQRIPLKLSTTLTLMVSAIIASVLLVVYALFFVQMSHEGQDQQRQKAMAIAETVALSGNVVDGLQREDHSGAIQRFRAGATSKRAAVRHRGGHERHPLLAP